jgi:hypothetical protein
VVLPTCLGPSKTTAGVVSRSLRWTSFSNLRVIIPVNHTADERLTGINNENWPFIQHGSGKTRVTTVALICMMT